MSKAKALEYAVSFTKQNLENNFEHYQLSYDETGITIDVWQDGLAMAASVAGSVGGENLESWNTMVDNFVSMTGSIRDFLDGLGLNDVVLSFSIKNDQNTDNILVMIMDKTLVYDVVNSELKEAESTNSQITKGMDNASKKADSYLRFSAFSAEGLTEQLEFEGFTAEEAKYAVENCGADWKQQALKKAESYLSFAAFSYDGLIDQLEYEGFTAEEASYGVDNCGADWFEQAAKKGKSSSPVGITTIWRVNPEAWGPPAKRIVLNCQYQIRVLRALPNMRT